jgi:anthranilate synthase component 1
MIGGLFGYLGYDMVRQMEHLPNRNNDPLGLPEAILLRPRLFVVFDHVKDELTVAAVIRPSPEFEAERALEFAYQRLKAAAGMLQAPLPAPEAAKVTQRSIEPEANMPKEAFLQMVRTIKEYIAAGDVFQVVASQRFSAPFELPPLDLYRALRRVSPAPFLFFFDFGDFALSGSSPEILVRVRNETITIRPLAGTRPRGGTPEEDRRLEADLLSDPKEHAEHLMLLDLGRNDVARAAQIGTVKVVQSFAVERFSHVMHMSSTVEGRIKPNLESLDALMSAFPAGTLSGAPKIRALEIIEELEPVRRGPYGGCLGYFAADGSMDTCIALRMAIVKDRLMHVQAGAGIVADSVPEAEYQETKQKARALFRAAEEAIHISIRRQA